MRYAPPWARTIDPARKITPLMLKFVGLLTTSELRFLQPCNGRLSSAYI